MGTRLALLALLSCAAPFALGEEPVLHDRPISHWLDGLERMSSHDGPDEPTGIADWVFTDVGPADAAAAGPIGARLAKTTDPDVQEALIDALCKIGSVPKDAVPTLERLAKQEDPVLRVNAAYLVWRATGDASRGWPALMDGLAGKETSGRAMVLLGRSGRLGIAAAPAVAKWLRKEAVDVAEHRDPMFREAAAADAAQSRGLAAWTLARMEATEQLDAVEKAFKAEEDAGGKARMALAIWRFRKDGRELLGVVRAGLKDPRQRVRILTASAIADLGPDASALVPDLEAALAGDDVLAYHALQALAAIGPAAAPSVPAILKVMEADPNDLDTFCFGLRALGAIGVRSDDVLAAIRKVDEAWGPHEFVAIHVREARRKLGAK